MGRLLDWDKDWKLGFYWLRMTGEIVEVETEELG